MGKRVHETLCKLYADRIMSRLDTPDELLGYYDSLWLKNWSDDILVVKKGHTAKDYQEKGRACIASYYRRYQPFDDSRTVGLEQMIAFDLEGYKIIGFIDRLSRREDGRYEIHDYKTTGSMPMPAYFDDDRQLALYQIGVEKTRKDVGEIDLVWHYLIHDKEVRSSRDRATLDGLKEDVMATIRQIESAEAEGRFPAIESALCKWCEYQSLCHPIKGRASQP